MCDNYPPLATCIAIGAKFAGCAKGLIRTDYEILPTII